ncbi:hypothetical protein DXG01_016543 [Tephrocybe rancida]|nr:hypothetical protein DXG01_016543 [Tephrocybe rancida]
MRFTSSVYLAVVCTPVALSKPAHSTTPANSLVTAGGHVIWSYAGLTPPDALYTAIENGQAAGVIFFGENINTNISTVVSTLKAANEKSPSKLPLLLMTDQEGGLVRRLKGAPELAAKYLCGNGTEITREGGVGAGENLLSVGMNVNLAPVLDVWRTETNFLEAKLRSFSNSPTIASECGVAFLEGEISTGIASTVKHFPGLGAAPGGLNTDLQVVSLNLTVSELRAIDEFPYHAAIAAGAPLVMLSWGLYPAFDKVYPAGLSPAIIQGELRHRLGFKGVTISDAFEAGALTEFGSYGDRSLLAAKAGMDLMLASARDDAQGQEIVTALATAYQSRTLDTQEFDEATKRIEKLRKSLKLQTH